VNEKPITGRTNGTKASAEQVGSIESKARTDGGHLGASGALSGPRKGESAARPLGKILRDMSGSQNPAAAGLTPTERLTVQIAIESEIHAIRKASTSDFQHGQRAIIRDCMRLDFLSADARRRLSACPLPNKAEALADLHRLLNFVR
jgi:hypothetical protein